MLGAAAHVQLETCICYHNLAECNGKSDGALKPFPNKAAWQASSPDSRCSAPNIYNAPAHGQLSVRLPCAAMRWSVYAMLPCPCHDGVSTLREVDSWHVSQVHYQQFRESHSWTLDYSDSVFRRLLLRPGTQTLQLLRPVRSRGRTTRQSWRLLQQLQQQRHEYLCSWLP